MAWGKIIGGALGAAVGGPIGAGIGVAIGAGFDGASEEVSPWDGDTLPEIEGLNLRQNGNVLQVTSTIPLPDDATDLVVSVLYQNRFVKGFVEPFIDGVGNFFRPMPVTSDPFSVDIPLHVLAIERNQPLHLRIMVGVRKSDGETLGILYGHVGVNIGIERWSLVRWLAPAVNLLTHYALRYGSWTSEKVRVIKDGFEGVTNGDPDELDSLKSLIKGTGRPSVDECIACYNRRSNSEEAAVSILVGVAALLQLSGRSDQDVASEIVMLGANLNLAPNVVLDMLHNLADDEYQGHDDGEDQGEEDESDAEAQRASAVLGVPLGSTRDVIQQAWRKKISELHPDKYTGLPEVVQNMIKEKAQELNQARDVLLKS